MQTPSPSPPPPPPLPQQQPQQFHQQQPSNSQYKTLVAGSATQTTHSNNGATSFSSFHQHLGPTQSTIVSPIKAIAPVIHHQHHHHQQQPVIYAAASQPIQSSYFPVGYTKTHQYNAIPAAVAAVPYQHVPHGPASTAIYTHQPNYQSVHYGTHLYQPGNGYSRINYGTQPKYS